MEYSDPVFYIIMREDIADMNPGKGMAQAAHAQADFSHVMRNISIPYYEDYADWCGDRSFGTTIVLSASLSNINEILGHCIGNSFPRGYVTDPTYPYRNFYGQMFVESKITCAWVFVPSLALSSPLYEEFMAFQKALATLHQ